MDHPPKSQLRRRGLLASGSALVASSVIAAACSAPHESANSRSQAIAGGTQDVAHQNVFLLVRHDQTSGALCTATLIAPNLLLTARHCVSTGTEADHVLCGNSMLGDPYPASAFVATNDAQPQQNSPFFHAADVRVPGVGVDTCGYDVALIILKDNVPSTISKPAVPRIDREVIPGETYTAVGYGLNAAGKQTPGRMELAGLSIACQPGSCGDGVESTEFVGETGICSGDSGGPALDEDGKVVGVVSRGGPDCGTPVYSTVTAWYDFIIGTAKDAAALGGYEAPFWVTTGLSDPPVSVGEGGSAGAAAEPGTPSIGDKCDGSTACPGGSVCYANSTGSQGVCSSLCTATAECSPGLECRSAGNVSVCATPTGNGDESSGCAIASTAPTRSTSPWWLVALGAFTLARRRQTRRD